MKKKIIILAITLLLAAGIRYLISDTTLFVDTSKTLDGYLPINDYVLLDEEGKEVNKIKSFNREYYSTSYDYDVYTTTLGINAHSTFEEFLDKYGNFKASFINCYKPDDEDNDSISEVCITPNEFYDTYIKTNRVNLDDYNIYITFNCATKLNDVYYSESKINTLYDQGILNFNYHLYSLSFSYSGKNYSYNDCGFGHFEYIASDKS